MASTQGIRAGRAFVELFADDKKLVRGLKQAERKLKAFGGAVRGIGLKTAAIGTAAAAPLAASTKLFASYGDEVAKMSRRTGISVEALSELGYAASQSGTGVKALENGVRRMQRTLIDADRGLGAAQAALRMLGLAAQDLNGLAPDKQFKHIAERLSGIEDPTRRAAIAMEIFGRAGAELLPLVADGAKGIEKLQAEARALGLTMSGKDAAAAELFTDEMTRLSGVIKMGAFNIGAALAPVLMDVAERLRQGMVALSEWIKTNRGFIVSALKLAAIVVAAGVAVAALGSAITGVGAAFGLLARGVTLAFSLLRLLGTTIGLLASPVGVAVAAVVGLGAALVSASGSGGKALDWMRERFGRLKADASETFGGIADALAAGDISLAARVLWLALKMEWTRGVNFLEKAWLNFRNAFIRIGYDAWSGLLGAVQMIWHALEVGWIETTAFFARVWSDFTAFFARTWVNIKAGATKAWNWIKSLFDESIDLAVENKLVEGKRNEAVSRINDERDRKKAERELERERSRARSYADNQAALAKIVATNLGRNAKLDADYAKRMSDNEAELVEAREAWREAVGAARARREAKDTDGAHGLLAGAADLVSSAAARAGVRGTFNAAAIRGMESNGAADRTAIATEETAKNTKRLLESVRNSGMVFG